MGHFALISSELMTCEIDIFNGKENQLINCHVYKIWQVVICKIKIPS